MTLLLSDDDVRALADPDFVYSAVRDGLLEQARGGVLPPSRMDVPLGDGWLRTMAVGVPAWGVYGVKTMNLTPGVGLRYAFALYEQSTGRLLALMDARTITAMRTAATAALSVDRLAPTDVDVLAVIGTGNEARRLLEAVHRVRPAPRVQVYSRSPENRKRFVEFAQGCIQADVVPCDHVADAVRDVRLVALATKSPTPVLAAAHVTAPCHVASIGASRRDQAEVAPELLASAQRVVCDSVAQVFNEAGDVRAAVVDHGLQEQDAVELADVVAATQVPELEGVSVYKSVGTALQDVAVAVPLLRKARRVGAGQDIGDFPSNKPFT